MFIFAGNYKKINDMKKIILGIIAVFTAGSIFAQTKAVNTSLTLKGESFKKAVLTEKASGDVIYYEDFDANELPAGWDTISYVSNWEFGASSSHLGEAYITYTTDQEQPKDAWLISPEITISDTVTNPVLMFDVSTSYYWLVGNNTDDVTVYAINYSGDSTVIWKEDDSTLVVNSLMPWPYGNFSWYTAKVDLSTFINDTIRIAFHYKSNDGVGGHNGVSFYLDNFLIRDDYAQDIVLEATLPMSYGVYWYGIQSFNQAWPYTVYRGLALNSGAEDLTSVNLNLTITDENGTVVLNETSNTFVGGNTSLVSHQRDTMEIVSTFEPDTTAEHTYTFSFNVTTDPEDQDMTNNSGEWTMMITPNWFGRTGTLTRTLSIADYSGGTSGDLMGTMLLMKNPDKADSIMFYLSVASTIGTSVQAFMYEWDNNSGDWQEKISSDAYDITDADTGTWVKINFNTDGFSENLSGETWYLLALKFFFDPDNGEDIRVGINDELGMLYSQNDDEGYKYSVNILLGGTWYYITSGVPAFILITQDEAQSAEYVNKDDAKIYPNPAKDNIYVENNSGATIEIYNLIGEKVKSITNAKRNATINVSDLNSGSYIVKVIENSQIKTAKVNIIK